MSAADGPWDKLTIQVWPIEKKSVNWPPPMSLSRRSWRHPLRLLSHALQERERPRLTQAKTESA